MTTEQAIEVIAQLQYNNQINTAMLVIVVFGITSMVIAVVNKLFHL